MKVENYKLYKYLLKLIGSKETKSFFEATQEEFPDVIRINTLKISKKELRDRLARKGFSFRDIELWDNALEVVFEPYEISKTPEHYAGLFYIQEKSSLVPVKVLSPEQREVVLDIAAAPGSKTTQMGEKMKNKGVILANDLHLPRIKALTHNIDRIGLINTAVTMLDGSRFGNLYYEKFDKVLVDAPCSSIGALHKVKEVLSWWNDREVNWFVNIQRRLLISAIKAVKPGGIIVYSTCTLTVEENELLINDIVEKYPIEVQKIEPLNINEEPGISEYHDKKLSPDIEKTIRIWPHKSFMEGFFIAKLLKTDKIKEQKPRHKKQKEYRKLLSINDGEIRKIVGFLEKEFGIEKDFFKDKLFKISKGVWLCSKEMEKFPVQESFREGLRLVRIHKQGIKLTTNAAQLLFPYIKRGILNIDSEEKVLKILKGEEVEINERGEGTRVIVYDGICLGMGVLRNKKLKSQIPMSRRFKEIIV